MLTALDGDLDSLGPRALHQPIHLLVPSHSLRRHLQARLAEHRGGGVVGVAFWTLHGLATYILDRAEESPSGGGVLLPVLVRRAARREAPLRQCLEHLNDGYSALADTVTDLLEAGLETAHVEALEESLTAEGRFVASAAEIRRACSLVRVAGQVQNEMAMLGLDTDSTLLTRATAALNRGPENLFIGSTVHVFGFSDATGLATDFILAALEKLGGQVYLDRPPDPIDWSQHEPGLEFGRRFTERLADRGSSGALARAPHPPDLALMSALGRQTEVREVAWRIWRLLEDGERPETIAIVARRLEPYRSALRTHLERLGIPFSAVGATGPGLPTARRIAALLDLMTRREKVRIERWFDARIESFGSSPLSDLRLALHGLGVGRLEELAALSRDLGAAGELALPVRQGFTDPDEGDADVQLERRTLAAADLGQVQSSATALCELFASWNGTRRWSDHLEQFRSLLDLLEWAEGRQLWNEVFEALERRTATIPDELEIDLEEWTLILRSSLESVGFDPFGGRGGGIQVLDVTEARGLTFRHLFLIGLDKGAFPRTIREDPALPDSLRHVLAREGHGVLPDLARKRAGHSEERHLFAQLVAASPSVTLSWLEADDDNREVTASPFVERLLWSHEPQRVRPQLTSSPRDSPTPEPRTAYENAIRSALWGSRRQLQANLRAGVPADQSDLASRLSRARVAILDEVDRSPARRARLGPYFGFVGPVRKAADPRVAQALFVTTLESLAVCPWRTFLERLLKLESIPDPVEVLPGIEPFVIGQVVHGALERIFRESAAPPPDSLEEARLQSGATAGWPPAAAVERIAGRAADRVLREQGITWPGYGEILAAIALPFLTVAHDLLRHELDEALPVAAEMSCTLEGGGSENLGDLQFRVDLVSSAHGRLILSDFKTGPRGVSDAVRPSTRDRHLLSKVRQGRLLQAVAYAAAAGRPEDCGRYLYLHPGFQGPEETRRVEVSASDEVLRETFESSLQTLLDGWRSGTFLPRLVEVDKDQEPSACRYCAVAEACLRGDSGARARLRDWAATDVGHDDLQAAALPFWRLGSNKGAAS